MQYTLRNIPKRVDQELRERARREGKSLNEVAVNALSRALGFDSEPIKHRDLTDIQGTWVEDVVTDNALEDQRQLDAELWE